MDNCITIQVMFYESVIYLLALHLVCFFLIQLHSALFLIWIMAFFTFYRVEIKIVRVQNSLKTPKNL